MSKLAERSKYFGGRWHDDGLQEIVSFIELDDLQTIAQKFSPYASQKASSLMDKFARFLNSQLGRTVVSYGLLQLIAALLSIVRIRLTISALGVSNYGIVATSLGIWILLSIIGESARRESRISFLSKNSVEITIGSILVDLISILSIIGAFFVFYRPSNSQDKQAFELCLVILGATAFLNGLVGMLQGILEGLGLTSQVNVLSLMGNLCSFPIVIFAASQKSLSLTLISYGALYLFPGIMYANYIKRHQIEIRFNIGSERNLSASRFRWMTLQVGELATFAIDPYLIALRLGNSSVAKFSIYQKVLILLTLTSTAIAPLAATARFKTNSKSLMRQFVKVNVYAAILMSSCILLLGTRIVSIISNSRFSSETNLLCATVVVGLIGTVTSTRIQSHNLGIGLNLRIISTNISALIGLILTWVLLPRFGIVVSFMTTGVSVLLVYIPLRVMDYYNED